MSKVNALLVGTAIAAMTASAASAATTVSITGDYNSYTSVSQSIVRDFDGIADLDYTFSTSPPVYIGSGTSGGQYAKPPGAPGNYLAVQSNGPGDDGTATLSRAWGFRSFSLFMGSPDTYNSLTFYYKDGSFETFQGNLLSNPFAATGDQSMAYRLNFDFGGKVATSVVATSIGVNAFESDGWAASAVPEPATWAMMIIGFGGVGSMVRSARRKAALSLA